MGDIPFASVNDHKSLAYVFDKPARVPVVSVAARDRLKRWAEYLRSYTFDTVHIPGASNHFCDLLSRSGCDVAMLSWKRSKRHQKQTVSGDTSASPGERFNPSNGPYIKPHVGHDGHGTKGMDAHPPQMAIIARQAPESPQRAPEKLHNTPLKTPTNMKLVSILSDSDRIETELHFCGEQP